MQRVTFFLSDWDFDNIDLSINQLIQDCDIDIDCTFTWPFQFLPRIGEVVALINITKTLMKDNEELKTWFQSIKNLSKSNLIFYLCECRVENIVHYGDEILIYLAQPDW